MWGSRVAASTAPRASTEPPGLWLSQERQETQIPCWALLPRKEKSSSKFHRTECVRVIPAGPQGPHPPSEELLDSPWWIRAATADSLQNLPGHTLPSYEA